MIRSIVPVVLALIAGGLLLLALSRNPLTFYGSVWKCGVENGAWQDSAILMAPLLLIAAGLTVVFRANIWNLGYDGQFLLGAAFVAGWGPSLVDAAPARGRSPAPVPRSPASPARSGRSFPALLKAKYGTNEIITTLMSSFIGDRRREHPDQGAVPGSDRDDPADARAARSTTCSRTSRERGSTAACSSPSRRSSSSTT